jgi:hypothetical protein
MANRNQKVLAIIDDDLADRAAAEKAMEIIWDRLRLVAKKGYVTNADIDLFSDNLRTVDAGLRTIKKYLVEIRSGELASD